MSFRIEKRMRNYRDLLERIFEQFVDAMTGIGHHYLRVALIQIEILAEATNRIQMIHDDAQSEVRRIRFPCRDAGGHKCRSIYLI